MSRKTLIPLSFGAPEPESPAQPRRRQLLKMGSLGAAALTMGGLLPGSSQAALLGISEPPLGQKNRFQVDIPSCPDASKNIREISIDELNIDIREMTTGMDVEYRLYGPGAAHWGQARITAALLPGSDKGDLYTWFQEAVSGKGIRKNITVTLFKPDKTAGRSYTLMDCFPTQWSSVNFDTSSTVQSETLMVNIGRVEFKT